MFCATLPGLFLLTASLCLSLFATVASAADYQAYDLPPVLEPLAQCDEVTRDLLASDFHDLKLFVGSQQKKYRGWSFGCFSEVSVFPAMWRVLHGRKNITYVDVGANKGESLTDVLQLFTDIPFHFILETSKVRGPACHFDRSTPTIYAVEPGPGNLKLLEALVSRLPKAITQNMHIVAAAMSDASGSMCMEGSQEAGNERAHISSASVNNGSCAEGHFPTAVHTFDMWLNESKINHVDYLKIDVEGFDPLVLRGAQGALKSGIVDVLSFEYHHIEHWNGIALKDVVDMLERVGFSSYFIGDFYLYKISDGCWSHEYAIKNWSNILAVRKDWKHHEKLLLEFHKASCLNRELPWICDRFGGRQPTAPPAAVARIASKTWT